MTNNGAKHIQAEIELGDGLPDIRLTGQCLEALKKAGFEVVFLENHFSQTFEWWRCNTYSWSLSAKVLWEKDLATDSPIPWYLPLDKNHFSLSSFRLTALGRFVTKNMVSCCFNNARFNHAMVYKHNIYLFFLSQWLVSLYSHYFLATTSWDCDHTGRLPLLSFPF